jgi:hypothetical protein
VKEMRYLMFGEEPPVILEADRLFAMVCVVDLGLRIKVNLAFRNKTMSKMSIVKHPAKLL